MQKSAGAERDLKAVALTRLFAPLPTYRKSIHYILVLSFFAGFALSTIRAGANGFMNLGGNLLFGGTEGVLAIGVPGILAAAFAASITRKEKFKDRLKHFSFIALLSVAISSVLYVIALLISTSNQQLNTIVLLVNSILFGVWFFALFVTLNYGWKTVFISLFQPLLNISFLIIYNSFLVADLHDPLTVGIKFVISTSVLLLAMASIFYILNAPAQRNFGISTMQVMALFSAQWTYGSKGLEEILAEMGEKVETYYGTVLFRSSRTRKLKGAWLLPYVHFGPVGNLGGSEFPYLLSKPISEKYSMPVGVYHATVNHDFNPVYSSLSNRFISAYQKEIDSLSRGQFENKMQKSLLASSAGTARVFGLTFGAKNGFFGFSNAPNSTEDVEFPAGMIFMNRLVSKGIKNALLADMHNSKTDGAYFLAGTPEFFEVYDLLDKYSPAPGNQFKFGAASDEMADLGIRNGIGKMGAMISVFESQGKKSCIILVDANNVIPEFRKDLLAQLNKKYKFDFLDIFTTDTHSVNTISGIHNPLGKYCNRQEFVKRIGSLIDSAIKDLEPSEAAVGMRRIGIEVLGARRSPEVISTINSIVSIAKIFAPSILIVSIVIAFILSLAIR